MIVLGIAFLADVRPLSTPASDPSITQVAIATIAHAVDAVTADGGATGAEPVPIPIGPLPANVPTASPSPAATPSQGAPYDATRNIPPPDRGGPLTVSINGNVLASRHLQFGGPPGGGAATESLGASIEIARRTTKTATRISLPTNVSAQSRAGLGAATGEYDTTNLSYIYGPQQISGLNLVPLGSTIRGLAVVSPLRRGGDLTFFGGPGQSGGLTYFARGVRLRTPVKNGFAGLTLFDGKVENDRGRTDGIALGALVRSGAVSTATEIVAERNSGVAGIPNGITFSAQSRLDVQHGLDAATITVRDQGRNFQNIGSVTSSSADVYGALGLRRASTNGSSVSLDLSNERYVTDQSTTSTRESLAYSTRVGATGSLQASLSNATGENGGQKLWNGGGQLSYGATFRSLAVQGSASANRQTTEGMDPTGSYGFGFGLAKVLGLTSAANAFYTYQQSSTSGNFTSSAQFSLGLSRQFVKTSVLGQLALVRSTAIGTDQRGISPTVTISRRISPSFTANFDVNGDFHRDRLQAANRAHTIGVNVSLGAPVAFGNGVTSGRINPRLPASIDGFVAQDGVSQSNGFGLQAGVGNILIVLDGTRSVRTDSRGQFEFRFITPGKHDVVIDPGSLPRGLTADQPSSTVTLSGGQTAHLALGVGTFGTIEGHLFGRDAKGGLIPVSEATLTLDDGQHTITNAAGYYGFGRLLPGKHTVKVELTTVPASIALPSDAAKAVSVIPGERIAVDFIGAPLGSIAGILLYDGSFDAAENGKPVPNAYVVANPGDHAAIVDEFGRFVIDNLPPGSYSVSVDEDTLADDHGTVSQTPLDVVLSPGGAVEKLAFTIGSKPRNVVFSFKQGNVNVLDIRLPQSAQPPGVGIPIVVKTSEEAASVYVEGLGSAITLSAGADKKTWRGTINVPTLARTGSIPLVVKATGAHPGDGSAKLEINQDLQTAFFTLTPARPALNQFVHVKARFFTEIHAGDRIVWSDGATTVLGQPSGSIVSFDVKMASIPYTGTLNAGGRTYRVVLRPK